MQQDAEGNEKIKKVKWKLGLFFYHGFQFSRFSLPNGKQENMNLYNFLLLMPWGKMFFLFFQFKLNYWPVDSLHSSIHNKNISKKKKNCFFCILFWHQNLLFQFFFSFSGFWKTETIVFSYFVVFFKLQLKNGSIPCPIITVFNTHINNKL